MLKLSKKQVDKFNEIKLLEFVKKIQNSLIENKITEEVDNDDLKKIIADAIKNYKINREDLIEDYCFLFYHFEIYNNNEIHCECKKILQHKTKPSQLKIDELFQYLNFTNK